MKLHITQPTESQKYYGHGKLLITGEYFVLDGACALAVPTRLGQHLQVKKLSSQENVLYWVAVENTGKPWLQLIFDTQDFSCINSAAKEAESLSLILRSARDLNANFLRDGEDFAVETKLEFARNWGLGSSATLIYCIAKWAGVDGFSLLQKSLGGSGYDVACAAYDTAITYRLQNNQPVVAAVNWEPAFCHSVYFAHLGHKQSSPAAINNYRQLVQDKTSAITEIDQLTQAALNCNDLTAFETLIVKHEKLIASELNQPRVKELLFADYWGEVKSLGAWGGDFVMITNHKSEKELKNYLAQRNITTVLRWNEMLFSQ